MRCVERTSTLATKTTTAPSTNLVDPLRDLAAREASGTMVLLGAGLIALLLANSPLSEAYSRLLELPLTAAAGDFRIEKPLLLWINDGLMGIFFFHVGLEIKREVRRGELSALRKAPSLPSQPSEACSCRRVSTRC